MQHHVLNTQDGGILVYRHAGSDPAKSPEGWYLEAPEDIYHEIMGVPEGQNALIAALKEKGIDFAEKQQKIQRMMSSIEKQINKEE